MGLEVGLLGCVSLACLLTPLYSQFFCQQTRVCTSQVTQSLSLKNRHSCQTKNTHVTLDTVRSKVHYLGRSQPEKEEWASNQRLEQLELMGRGEDGPAGWRKAWEASPAGGVFPSRGAKNRVPTVTHTPWKGLTQLEDHRWSRKAGVGPILGSWLQQSTTKKTYWDN